MADLVARPDDVDLDVDIDGISVTAVVLLGDDLLVRFTGGWGTVGESYGPAVDVLPGEEETSLTAEALVQWSSDSPKIISEYVELLERWRDLGTPLHLVGAPGKMFALLEDEEQWLPLPR